MPHKDEEQRKQYRKDYYQRYREKLLQDNKERYHSNTSVKVKVKEQSQQWMKEHPEYRLWKQARDSSKQRGLDFDITVEDIVIPERCTYLGIVLTDIRGGGRYDSNISLDRINNTIGYVKGNLQVISSKANYMKRNASIEELIEFAKGVLNTHG
jgi:hypothetical protein